MTPPKIQEVTTDEQRDDPVCLDSQNTIPDELLPSLNAYNSKSIIVHPSTNRELQTPIQNIRIRQPFKFKESPYTIKFGSAAGSSTRYIHIFPQKHSLVYHPIDGIVDTKIVKKFMDWISVDLLKVHGKKKEKMDHYKKGKLSIPMMHFEVETVEDKNWFYTIGFPDQSWTESGHPLEQRDHNRGLYPWHAIDTLPAGVIVLSYRYQKGLACGPSGSWASCGMPILENWGVTIFLYDSYESSSHYSIVLAEIEKLAEIIPLYIQACDFYDKKGIDLQNHPRYKDTDSSNMFDVLFEENFPQQPSGSFDCGVYMVTYAECVSYDHKIFSTDFDFNALRTRYAALLWDYGIRKQEASAHSDVEAPLRPAKQSTITSVTEIFDV
ncbi:hypothetical protein T459_02375 [Capsicum annuum]|uniref:Ubiquitin-like protease family profile domain-containing protein n=1 Tax=Capsicum annuum TaxID=4072 RepID=A0A2G3AK09_CAPAN|nr:hypothetical protein T459_02375 [Capsicum annuum]